MNRSHNKQDRILKMALLRARAGLQRQQLEQSIRSIGTAGAGGWASKALLMYRRYPYIVSTVSGYLSSSLRGRHKTVWRVALAAVAAWQLARGLKGRKGQAKN